MENRTPEPERPYIRKPDGTCIPLALMAIKTSPEEAARREKFEAQVQGIGTFHA
ncbi:MAG: hypothetical protein HC790_13590 [Acaryochloridaceae cyanobacterium CSU_3_4]|nr:hypothetical protein [Acaryochloridaceae cyanobacterium CSU_3_4]